MVEGLQRHRDRATGFARAAWVMLDWAASGFSTVLITLVVAYVERGVFHGGGWGLEAGVIWAWTLAAAMLVSAVVSPWAAARADRHDAHQRWLALGTLVGAGGLVALAATPPAARSVVLAAVLLACVGFDLAQVFTGSLLPRIAGPADADRLSAQGFAAGYAGGGLALVAATGLVTMHDRFGLDMAGGLRLAFVFTAGWWVLFSIPAAIVRFGDHAAASPSSHPGGELLAFVRSLCRRDAADGAFAAVLAGSMLALGGVQTAISQFTSLAIQRFDLDGQTLVKLVLFVQAVALPGALVIGWVASRWGRRVATAICLGGWMCVLVCAWFVGSPAELWRLAAVLAVVLGGTQSVLRAAVAVLAPEGRSGVTFGLLQVGTKLAGFVAGLAFGLLQMVSGLPQAGLVALVVQIAVAWWLLRGMR
jgi:UMF1 family MFS transporter